MTVTAPERYVVHALNTYGRETRDRSYLDRAVELIEALALVGRGHALEQAIADASACDPAWHAHLRDGILTLPEAAQAWLMVQNRGSTPDYM